MSKTWFQIFGGWLGWVASTVILWISSLNSGQAIDSIVLSFLLVNIPDAWCSDFSSNISFVALKVSGLKDWFREELRDCILDGSHVKLIFSFLCSFLKLGRWFELAFVHLSSWFKGVEILLPFNFNWTASGVFKFWNLSNTARCLYRRDWTSWIGWGVAGWLAARKLVWS